MGLQVTCTGMSQGTPPDPCLTVIFGASGDLAQNSLIPSLYALASQRLLPGSFAIIGMSRRAWGDETFRDAMRDIVKNNIAFREDVCQSFGRGLYYNPGDVRSAEGYAALREKVKEVQAQQHLPGNILYHCATPPSLYGNIVEMLAQALLLTCDHGWRRVIIAKWEAEPATHLATYAAGSWGPAAAEALLMRDGRAWLAV
jgi:glucose-6-phosphate 1-dehydrogenase